MFNRSVYPSHALTRCFKGRDFFPVRSVGGLRLRRQRAGMNHDGHRCRAPFGGRERQHPPRWRFGAAIWCSRRVRAASAAEWPTSSGSCMRWANGMRAWLAVILAYSARYARISAAILEAWWLRGARWPRRWSDLLVSADYAKRNRNIRVCTV